MYFVYVLQSQKTGRFYTGSCEFLDRRFNEHNSGRSKATKAGIPWTLIYHESHPTRALAVQRERFLKTGKGREFLRAQVK